MRFQSIVYVAAAALVPAAAARETPAAEVTFARDIRPILQAHCTVCHAAGGSAPMPLVTYDDVLPWAPKIKEQALSRRMPRWDAARGYGGFANDPTLSPFELQAIAAWADGSRLRGTDRASAVPRVPTPPPTATQTGWVTGWTFLPGDPLITSATFTSADGRPIAAWTAGDQPVRLPYGTAMRIVAPVKIAVTRRRLADFEKPASSRPSRLSFTTLPPPPEDVRSWPERRMWTERASCGGALGPAEASIVAVRPILKAGASAQIAVERFGGAQPALLGWFREFDPAYPRIYWLARPIDFAASARITSDAPCEIDVTLSAGR
jgi:mono/diheme cytochrome c family protein